MFETLLSHWIITIILIACVTSVITSFAKQLRKYACHRNEVELKRDLVERGLSVDEIERIVAANSSTIGKEDR